MSNLIMNNTAHKFILNGVEYTRNFGGSGSEPGPGPEPGPTRTLLYTLQQGAVWESFSNTDEYENIVVESTYNNKVDSTVYLSLSDLPYFGNYTPVAVVRDSSGIYSGNLIPINMATVAEHDTIYISTNGISADTIKVYGVDEEVSS